MPTNFQASRFNNIKKIRKIGRSPLSILYRLFFETQGRKYGRNLNWSCFSPFAIFTFLQLMEIIKTLLHSSVNNVCRNKRHLKEHRKKKNL